MSVCIWCQEFTRNSQEHTANVPAALTDLLSEGLSHEVRAPEHVSSCKDMLQRLSGLGVSCRNFPAKMLVCPHASLASFLSSNSPFRADGNFGLPKPSAGRGGMRSLLRGCSRGGSGAAPFPEVRWGSAPGWAPGPWALSPLLRQLAAI